MSYNLLRDFLKNFVTLLEGKQLRILKKLAWNKLQSFDGVFEKTDIKENNIHPLQNDSNRENSLAKQFSQSDAIESFNFQNEKEEEIIANKGFSNNLINSIMPILDLRTVKKEPESYFEQSKKQLTGLSPSFSFKIETSNTALRMADKSVTPTKPKCQINRNKSFDFKPIDSEESESASFQRLTLGKLINKRLTPSFKFADKMLNKEKGFDHLSNLTLKKSNENYQILFQSLKRNQKISKFAIVEQILVKIRNLKRVQIKAAFSNISIANLNLLKKRYPNNENKNVVFNFPKIINKRPIKNQMTEETEVQTERTLTWDTKMNFTDFKRIRGQSITKVRGLDRSVEKKHRAFQEECENNFTLCDLPVDKEKKFKDKIFTFEKQFNQKEVEKPWQKNKINFPENSILFNGLNQMTISFSKSDPFCELPINVTDVENNEKQKTDDVSYVFDQIFTDLVSIDMPTEFIPSQKAIEKNHKIKRFTLELPPSFKIDNEASKNLRTNDFKIYHKSEYTQTTKAAHVEMPKLYELFAGIDDFPLTPSSGIKVPIKHRYSQRTEKKINSEIINQDPEYTCFGVRKSHEAQPNFHFLSLAKVIQILEKKISEKWIKAAWKTLILKRIFEKIQIISIKKQKFWLNSFWKWFRLKFSAIPRAANKINAISIENQRSAFLNIRDLKNKRKSLSFLKLKQLFLVDPEANKAEAEMKLPAINEKTARVQIDAIFVIFEDAYLQHVKTIRQ